MANILTDTISKLSREQSDGGISEISFEKFSKYILEFIEKESLTHKIFDKLVHRLRLSEIPKEIRNLGTFIYHIGSSERNLKKLLENADFIRIKLEVENFEEIIKNIISKYKRNPKIDRNLLQELQKKLFSKSDEIYEELR